MSDERTKQVQAMLEDNARENLDSVKGLGRRFSWRNFLDGRLPLETCTLPQLDTPCDCYDESDS